MRQLSLVACLAAFVAGGPAAADSLDEIRSGNAAYAEGRYEAAIDAYSQAILAGDLDPDALAVTFNNRGVAYSELGDYDRAIQDYAQALSLKSGDATAIKNLRIAHIRRAGAAINLGERDQAMADYAKAIELEPNHPLAYIRRAQLHRDKGDTGAAIADLERAQAIEPGNADAAALLEEIRASTPAVAAAPEPAAPAEAAPPAVAATEPAAPAQPEPSAPPAPVAAEPAAGPPAAPAVTAAAPPAARAAEPPASVETAGPEVAGRPYRVLNDVNFREGPGNDYPRVGTLASGSTVQVVGERLGWLEVRLRNGRSGFVYRRWLEPLPGGEGASN